ncbi:MAG: hypothetical protein CMJ76_10630 [Planctomycetaceae bacterium]|nr:hypothetical protein [Planctomycetaceae bacterium]
MKPAITRSFVLLALFSSLTLTAEDFSRAQLEHFERTIRPVLVKHCISCHGPQRQEADLRLDSREAILAGGTRGPSVDLTDKSAGVLLNAIRYQGDLEMPPEKRLSDSDINNFAKWIRQGIAWPERFELPSDLDPTNHWAFQPIANATIPNLTDTALVETSVDPFIINRLGKHGLHLNARADKATLARRIYQDLTGLPPTVEQLNTFLKDERPDAYNMLVESALASPQFGVHWARMWMDIARYADNKGYIFYLNKEFKWAYTYREYLIEAFNEDRSYQRMILEQLAADQIVNEDLRPLRAMGFVTLGDYFVNNKYDMIDDRIDVITRGLMGLTVTCARCHDHKFDPIPTADYYGLYGVLDSSHDPIVPPLYDTPPNTSEYIEFNNKLSVKQKALDEFVSSTINALKEDGRTRIAEYLIAAYNERNNPDSDNFMLLTDKGALNPRMIRRWKNHLKDAQAKDSAVWEIWNAFAALPDDEFESRVMETYQNLNIRKDDFNSIIADYVLETQPSSMQEIAQRYEKALLYVKSSLNLPGMVCDEPEIQEIISSMYGPSAPADIPVNIGFDFLDLFPDRATQADFKRVLEDVENFIRNDDAAPPRALVLIDNDSPTEPFVFNRGNPNNRGPYVPRKFLTVLDPTNKPFAKGSGRLELANQIASPSNPLTARVMVNRLWAQLLGQGIVATPSDFGLRGAKPSHPELLDHLAQYFIDQQWSIKSVIRLIVNSHTYQQSSDTIKPAPDVDPSNALLWKANRKRLSWEQTRDSLIHATGELDETPAGQSFGLQATWIPRRSVFSYINRLDIPTLLRTFDYPSPNASSATRSMTTVPQQALWFFNNPFISEVTTRISLRKDLTQQSDDVLKVRRLYEILFSRQPDPTELSAIRAFLSTSADDSRFRDLIQVLLMSNEFIYVN